MKDSKECMLPPSAWVLSSDKYYITEGKSIIKIANNVQYIDILIDN